MWVPGAGALLAAVSKAGKHVASFLDRFARVCAGAFSS